MKKFTRTEIAKHLSAVQSAEFDETGVTYYLHIKEDGDLQISIDRADATFTASAKYADYTDSETWDFSSCSEEVYDRETLDDPTFAEIVDSLTEQANAWLEENR